MMILSILTKSLYPDYFWGFVSKEVMVQPIQKASSPNQERGGVNKDMAAHVSVNLTCRNRDKRNSLRLLSDELHRPTCERATQILYV